MLAGRWLCCRRVLPVDRARGRSWSKRRRGGLDLGDSGVPGETGPSAEIESVDILNEALGPLLLALGFPIEPYAVDGRWIVTGPRMASLSSETVGSPGGRMD